MSKQLTIALTKGRILKETLPLLAAADIVPLEDINKSRKLIFSTNHADIRLLVQRGADVTTYVKHGAADMGVSGKDMLLEYGSEGLYELLDLKIAQCKLMTAVPVTGSASEHRPGAGRRLRIATKFVNVAKRYYAQQGIQADIIKLYGGMELAPLMDLADEIVDIVDTGNTLKANGLVAKDEIADVSSRLIVNKASLKMKHQQIQLLVDQIAKAVCSV